MSNTNPLRNVSIRTKNGWLTSAAFPNAVVFDHGYCVPADELEEAVIRPLALQQCLFYNDLQLCLFYNDNEVFP